MSPSTSIRLLLTTVSIVKWRSLTMSGTGGPQVLHTKASCRGMVLGADHGHASPIALVGKAANERAR